MLDRWTEIAGLIAALCWALGGLIFSRLPIGVGALNLGKNLAAAGLLAAVVLTSSASRIDLGRAGVEPLLWLAASAVVGILIGDASYLRSLQLLGPRRALILSTLVPIFSAGVGWYLLAEALTGFQLLGIALTLSGVVMVIRERSPVSTVVEHLRGTPTEGVLHGVLGALCQAVGTALSKKGMVELAPMDASFVRLAVAVAGGIVLALCAGKLRRWGKQLRQPGVPSRIFLGSVLATFLGIWLSLVAVDNLPLAIANTQIATTPIFMTAMVALILRERVSPRAWIATAVATGGVTVLILGARAG